MERRPRTYLARRRQRRFLPVAIAAAPRLRGPRTPCSSRSSAISHRCPATRWSGRLDCTHRFRSLTGSSELVDDRCRAGRADSFGSLWLLYERTGDNDWKVAAESRLVALESQNNDTSTHDRASRSSPASERTPTHRQRSVSACGPPGAHPLATRYSAAVERSDPGTSDRVGFPSHHRQHMNLEICSGERAMAAIPPGTRSLSTTHSRPASSTFAPTAAPIRWSTSILRPAGESKTTHQGSTTNPRGRGPGWRSTALRCRTARPETPAPLHRAQRADYFISTFPRIPCPSGTSSSPARWASRGTARRPRSPRRVCWNLRSSDPDPARSRPI